MDGHNYRVAAATMLAVLGLIGFMAMAKGRCAAQSSPGDMGHSASAAEPSIDQKVAELKAAKEDSSPSGTGNQRIS